MFERIKSMTTVRDLHVDSHACDQELTSPICQGNTVWKVVSAETLSAQGKTEFSRPFDSTGILDDIAVAKGPPTAMCVLGDNVIGAANWEQIPLAEQYRAVTERAGAFVASNMHYLRLSGPDAAAVLNTLTPRDLRKLSKGKAMFTLFTTAAGTIDEEAIVLRTGDEEYLVSCGGGKPPSWLSDSSRRNPQVEIEHCDIVSFNLKGPRRMEAMQTLVQREDAEAISVLRPFQACSVQTFSGDAAWVLRTVVGIEMWAPAPVIRRVWHRILEYPDTITPCAWDLLNVYRMECTAMVFAVYPVDVNSGTSLWEAGYGWMIEKGEGDFFIGQSVLEQTRDERRLWLGGLKAVESGTDAPPVGTEVYAQNNQFAGYVTSAAFSIKHERALAFAHLKPEHQPGDSVRLNGSEEWTICRLPFAGG